MNKPKRKRTPSRRRKFLLMIVLPIVALMVGFVALSPQIDTWLATDPFTPQCQFEQDRLFAYGKPPQFASINSGQYNVFETYELPTKEGVRWSPNGRYLAYHLSDEEIVLQDMSNNEIVKIFPYSVSQSQVIKWYWSPDSRYLSFGLSDNNGTTRRYFMGVTSNSIDELDFVGIVSEPITSYIDPLWWSPNSQYALVNMSNDKWVLFNMDKLTSIELAEISGNSSSPYWTSDTEFYLASNNNLQLYDVDSNTITDIASLPYNDITAIVVHDDTIAMLWTYDGIFVYNLETKSVVDLEGDFLTWDGNSIPSPISKM